MLQAVSLKKKENNTSLCYILKKSEKQIVWVLTSSKVFGVEGKHIRTEIKSTYGLILHTHAPTHRVRQLLRGQKEEKDLS